MSCGGRKGGWHRARVTKGAKPEERLQPQACRLIEPVQDDGAGRALQGPAGPCCVHSKTHVDLKAACAKTLETLEVEACLHHPNQFEIMLVALLQLNSAAITVIPH